MKRKGRSGKHGVRGKKAQQTSVTAKTEELCNWGMPLNQYNAVRETQKYLDKIKSNIPEYKGSMLAKLKEGVKLDQFVGQFNGSALFINGLLFIADHGRGSVEMHVMRHGDREGHTEFRSEQGLSQEHLQVTII